MRLTIADFRRQIEQAEAWKFIEQQDIKQNYIAPINNVYTNLPSWVTELKFNYLENADYQTRILALNGLALFTSMLTLYKTKGLQVFPRILSATRNTTLIYFMGGLMIAPEIYNPLMKQ